MSWGVAIGLVMACFAAMAFLFRVPRNAWLHLGAALAVGLAGYGLQASPGVAGAPASGAAVQTQDGWRMIELRKELVGSRNWSKSSYMVTADALVREGQNDNAAGLLRGVVNNNPRDGEAWLALANALASHADGVLTDASLYAYRQAAANLPDTAGPSFFVGLAMIREGRLIDARELWAQRLESLPEGAPGRAILAERLASLDELMRRIVENAGRNAR